MLTLEQVLANIRQSPQHPNSKRSLRMYAVSFYKQGYYMKDDGYYYGMHGGKEYRKYSTH